MKKKLRLLLAIIVASIGSMQGTWADNTHFMSVAQSLDFSKVLEGEDCEIIVNIDLDTTEEIGGWSIFLYFPEGMSLRDTTSTAGMRSCITLPTEIHDTRNSTLTVGKSKDGGYLIMGVNYYGDPTLKSTKGEFLRIALNWDVNGDGVINLSDWNKIKNAGGKGYIRKIEFAPLSGQPVIKNDDIEVIFKGIKEDQSLSLSNIPTQTYGGTYSLSTTTTEGLPLTWTVSDATVASVSDGSLIALKTGTTKVTATQAGNDDYKEFSREFTLTVNKAPLTITANDANKTYGAANPTFTVSYDGFVNSDDNSVLTTLPVITTTATKTSGVGTYPITARGAEAANYDITYVAGTLTVNKASQSVSISEIPSMNYGGDSYVLPGTTTSGQALTWSVSDPTVATIADGKLKVLKAGTTKVTASQAGNENYAAFSKIFNLTVAKKPLTITANDAVKIYGKANPELTVSYDGFADGDDASSLATQPVVTTTATKNSAVGTYPITVSGASADNYDITYVSGTLTVNKASQSISISEIPSMNYGDNSFVLPTASTAGLTLSWNVGDPTVATINNGTITTLKAGSTKVTATQAGNENYAAFSKEYTLTVNKVSLTVTANNANKTYGTANPTFTVSYDGFVNSDDASSLVKQPTVTTTAIKTSAVGTYPITASEAEAANYEITYVAGTLTVNKASLTITANDCTKNVNDENPVFTVRYDGFVNDDNASSLIKQPVVTTTATKDSPVGRYPIIVSGAESDNYDISYVAGSLIVSDEMTKNNTLGGIDTKGLVGTKSTLEVALTNVDVVKLCQFDLRLPEGVTVALNSKGKLDATLSDRAETHTISSRQLSNGDYRFVVSSLDGDSFSDNEGVLMTIVLDIAENAVAGEYKVKVFDIELSVPEGSNLRVVKPADAESMFTINDYIPGDVNNDGAVSVTDVGYVINYILEQTPSVFIFDAADMNQDGKITVTDVGYIINLILSDASNSRKARFQTNGRDPE